MEVMSGAAQRKPYPIPEGLQANERYARILQNCYSGRDSELTAVSQYMYHHIEANLEYGKIARTIKNIAIMEMHHMGMLGECILQLGLKPKYIVRSGNRRNFWSAGLVVYGRSIRNMLEADRDAEGRSIALYEQVLGQIDEPKIQQLINRILEDEREHLQILNSILKEF